MPTADPSEVVALLLQDLSTLGNVAPPGKALTAALPTDSPGRRFAFSWPSLRETPDPDRPGGPETGASIVGTFYFKFVGHVRLHGEVDPPLALYDTGSRLRALFHNPRCAIRSACFSAVLGEVLVDVAMENQAKTFAGEFLLTVRYEDIAPETLSEPLDEI
jgi:hypothetical protein